jgi:hypothetical protein
MLLKSHNNIVLGLILVSSFASGANDQVNAAPRDSMDMQEVEGVPLERVEQFADLHVRTIGNRLNKVRVYRRDGTIKEFVRAPENAQVPGEVLANERRLSLKDNEDWAVGEEYGQYLLMTNKAVQKVVIAKGQETHELRNQTLEERVARAKAAVQAMVDAGQVRQ